MNQQRGSSRQLKGRCKNRSGKTMHALQNSSMYFLLTRPYVPHLPPEEEEISRLETIINNGMIGLVFRPNRQLDKLRETLSRRQEASIGRSDGRWQGFNGLMCLFSSAHLYYVRQLIATQPSSHTPARDSIPDDTTK